MMPFQFSGILSGKQRPSQPGPELPDSSTVLVAEPDADNFYLLALILESFDVTCIQVHQVQQLFSLAQALSPALIISELRFADGCGLTEIANLKRNVQTAGIPAIAITADAFPLDRNRCLAIGFDAYLSKPYVVTELEALLKLYLRQRK